jgi:Family of unknown function (DUF6461)
MGARVAEATAADYAWFKDYWPCGAYCITLVRGLDEVEVLRRFGGERSQPRTLTVGEAGELSRSFHAGYPQIVLAARSGGWAVALEDNGWEGWRPEVLRALSGGTQAVSVFYNGSEGYFSYAVDGEVLVQFELLFPQRRWGSQPDLLLSQMRTIGLNPDWHEPPHGELDTAALALADRLSGVHLDPRVLDGPLPGVEIAPLLDDPPASFSLGEEDDVELAAAIDQAAPGVLRRAAATAARQAVLLAQLNHDPVVVEALAAAQAGHARQVDDHSPLGWRIRRWGVEAGIADRVLNDPARRWMRSESKRACSVRPGGLPSSRSRIPLRGWAAAGPRCCCAGVLGRRSARHSSPTRAPRCTPHSRSCAICQATRGWRFVLRRLRCCSLATRLARQPPTAE